MIGDTLHIKPHYRAPAHKIFQLIGESIKNASGPYTMSIGGESGSGKSTLGLAIQQVLEEGGYKSFIFHLDDYFKLPPKDNHEHRLESLDNVGPHEVKLDLLQEHISQTKKGVEQLKKPLIHYKENNTREVIVEMSDMQVAIVEGTYATLLDDIDCKIFMLRDYVDTYENRRKRARDPIMPFNEKVLKIEHEIIKKHALKAHILVDKNYQIKPQRI